MEHSKIYFSSEIKSNGANIEPKFYKLIRKGYNFFLHLIFLLNDKPTPISAQIIFDEENKNESCNELDIETYFLYQGSQLFIYTGYKILIFEIDNKAIEPIFYFQSEFILIDWIKSPNIVILEQNLRKILLVIGGTKLNQAPSNRIFVYEFLANGNLELINIISAKISLTPNFVDLQKDYLFLISINENNQEKSLRIEKFRLLEFFKTMKPTDSTLMFVSSKSKNQIPKDFNTIIIAKCPENLELSYFIFYPFKEVWKFNPVDENSYFETIEASLEFSEISVIFIAEGRLIYSSNFRMDTNFINLELKLANF